MNINRILATMFINFRSVGWVQGTLQDDDGEVCYVGSYNLALRTLKINQPEFPDDDPMLAAVANRLGFGGERPVDDMIAWNDTPGRTLEEVTERLRQGLRGELEATASSKPQGMDIGEEIRRVKVEPMVEPIPEREKTAPARTPTPQRAPKREPARKDPRRAPTRVPQKQAESDPQES